MRRGILLAVIIGVVAICTLAGDEDLFEDFSGDLIDQWQPYGSPSPGISETMGNPAPSMYPNGDGSYDSGAISRSTFSFAAGLVLEADFYVIEGSGFDPGISFGLQNPTNRGLDRVGPGSDYSVLIRYAWDSTGGWQGNLAYHALGADGTYMVSFWDTHINQYLNGWHRFRIEITPSGYVRFSIDGQLLETSPLPLDLKYDNVPVLLGRKRSTAYVDNVSIMQGSSNAPPVAVCQPHTAYLDASGTVTISASAVDGGSTDDSGIVLMTVTPDTFGCSDVGPNSVTLTVEDAEGETDSCVATVSVVDNIVPVIALNGASELWLECGVDTYTELGATVTDNCCSGLSPTIDGDTVDTSSTGDYVVTYDVTDCNGNDADQVTRMVHVQDTLAPVITLSGDAEMWLECNVDTYTEPGATAADECCITAAVAIDGDTVDTSSTGDYVVTYDVTDCNGNDADQVTRTVHVQDTLPPVISGCPKDIEVSATAGASGIQVWWEEPTASDVGTGVSSFLSMHAPGDWFPVGTTTVTYTAVDGAGNESTCAFDVVVNETYDIVESFATLRFLDRSWSDAAGGTGGLDESPVIGELAIATIFEADEVVTGCCMVVDYLGHPVEVRYLTVTLYATTIGGGAFDAREPLDAWLLYPDLDTLAYCFSFETLGLEPGYYDIRIGLPFMDHEWIRFELIAPQE